MSEGTEAMSDRVLRWVSTIALVLLALDAARSLAVLPSFPLHGPIVLSWGPAYFLGTLLLPTTATALGDVSGVATLVFCLQRKQWGWFVGALLCLMVYFYASLALAFAGGITALYRLAGSAFALGIYLTLYYLLALTPIVVLAAVYAWTRRRPVSDATAPSP
jgi:hypothetical protein